MKPETDDIRRTREFGYSHDQAQRMMPFALGAVALGLVLIVPLDGAERAENWALGWLVVAAALVFIGIIVWRRTQPNDPYIVVSERGVLFKLVSDRVVPWDEIIAVDTHYVSAPRDFLSTKVVRLKVSERFFEAYARDKVFDSVTALDGDPSEIYLAYAITVPHDEMLGAISRRWRAYSHHAERTGGPQEPAGWDIGDAPTPTGRRRVSVAERARSFEGLGAFLRLLAGGSPGVALGNFVALAAIASLLTNLMGYWSTGAQVRGRERAAESKAWHEKHEAERQRIDAEIKRAEERFERAFRCMDESFNRYAGTPPSPECANQD